jgi:hypothetical protein
MANFLNESIIRYINTLTVLPSNCQDIIDDPNDEKAEAIASLIDECDEELSAIKKDILAIIQNIQEEVEINVEKTENGLKLGDSENGK